MKNLLIGLGLGAFAGAVSALLYSPGKGSQNRKRFLKSTTSLSDQIKELVSGKSTASHNGRARVVHARSNGHKPVRRRAHVAAH